MNHTRTPAWQTHHFRAMGSEIGLWLEADAAAADEAFAAVEALFAANEAALSRFRPTSELSRLSGRSGAWTPVSDLLWDVLREALALAAETDGLFDPTLLHAIEAAGYTRSFEQLTTVAPAAATAPGANHGRWTAVRLDERRQAVWLPPGVGIDLGGNAKGYTAQQAVDLLGQWGPCLVDAGGDLVAGAAPTDLPGWPVGVARPSSGLEQAEADVCTLWLVDASLATSGIDYRRWQQNGRLAHHLIDPRTGRPADTDALTVTVLAAEAGTAEAWATAALILGLAAGRQRLLAQGLAAVLIGSDGQEIMTPALRPFLMNAALV